MSTGWRLELAAASRKADGLDRFSAELGRGVKSSGAPIFDAEVFNLRL